MVLIGVGGTLSWHFDKILNLAPDFVDDPRIMFMLMVLSAAIRFRVEFFFSVLYAQQRSVLQNLMMVIGDCVRLIHLFTFVLGVSVGGICVVVATAAGQILGLVALLVLSLRTLPEQRFDRSKFVWSTTRGLTKID